MNYMIIYQPLLFHDINEYFDDVFLRLHAFAE